MVSSEQHIMSSRTHFSYLCLILRPPNLLSHIKHQNNLFFHYAGNDKYLDLSLQIQRKYPISNYVLLIF